MVLRHVFIHTDWVIYVSEGHEDQNYGFIQIGIRTRAFKGTRNGLMQKESIQYIEGSFTTSPT